MKLLLTFFLFIIISSISKSQDNVMKINLHNEDIVSFNIDKIDLIQFNDNNIKLDSFRITENYFELTVGKTKQLTCDFFPNNASNQKLSWISDATNIATVDNNGLVTAIKQGQARIIAMSEEGNFISTSLGIIVNPTKVCITQNEIKVQPNPANDFIKVELVQNLPFEITITDMNGNIIFAEYDKKEINISKLSSGSYLVTLHINSNYFTYKILKI